MIGSLTDANQRKWDLVVPEMHEGSFGVLDNENFVYYMSYPASEIIAASLTHEIEAYNEPELVGQSWGLNITSPGFVFSRNVAGYYIPTRIPADAISRDGQHWD